MSQIKGNSLEDRLQNQAKARAELIAKMKAMPGPNDPATLARQAEMKAIAEAREARAAERQAAKERAIAEEAARQEALRLAEIERLRLEEEARKADEELTKLAQKLARDERYANRKKKKKR